MKILSLDTYNAVIPSLAPSRFFFVQDSFDTSKFQHYLVTSNGKILVINKKRPVSLLRKTHMPIATGDTGWQLFNLMVNFDDLQVFKICAGAKYFFVF